MRGLCDYLGAVVEARNRPTDGAFCDAARDPLRSDGASTELLDSIAQSQPHLTSQGARRRAPCGPFTAEPLRLNWHRHTSRRFALDTPKFEADDRFIRTLKKDRFMTRVLRCLVVFGILVAGPWLAPTPAIAGSADFWATPEAAGVEHLLFQLSPASLQRRLVTPTAVVVGYPPRVWYYYSCTCQL